MGTAMLTGLKEAANPAHLRAGLVAAAEKSKELAEAAPALAGQVLEPSALPPALSGSLRITQGANQYRLPRGLPQTLAPPRASSL